MKTPLSWLREFVPIPDRSDPAALADTLSNLGLVVDGVERVGRGLEAIVVAKVLQIDTIEGADRIRHVTVDAGDGELGIVCGAWNFAVGDLVPLARVGTVLPNGMEIGRRKMRGVVSEGMLCSGRELELSEDAGGLLVLPAGLTPGAPLVDALGIVPDVVFDLDVAPNRPDCMSIAGVARDLAAKLGLPFALPAPVVTTGGAPASEVATVEVTAPSLCTRLTARVVRGVPAVPSPPEVARRLLLCGMRPIDAVVDASNYVMLELGQPTHPYDLDLLRGGLVARAAADGERVVTLDGVERELLPSDCVIGDPSGRAVGIGGVMGGGETEISASTTTVLLEAAHFVPVAISRTGRRLGLRTEASVRFERGCDPEMPGLASDRYCELLVAAAVAGGAPVPVVAPGALDARPEPASRTRLKVRTSRVNHLLGTALGAGEVAAYLEPIGFSASASADDDGSGVLEVVVPSFRPDVTREVDVIEEVARHHGYARIEGRARRAATVGALTLLQRRRRELRRALVALGAHEAWTSSLVAPADHARAGLPGTEIPLANPMAPEESVLRRSLLPGLLTAVAHNTARRAPHLRLFEIGHVFTAGTADQPGGGLPGEREVAAVVLAWDGDDAAAATRCWRAVADALGLKGAQLVAGEVPGLHPTRAALLVGPAGDPLGALGEVDPGVLEAFGLPHARVGWFEAEVEPLVALAVSTSSVREPSRYPSADIDLAFAVGEGVPAADVEHCLRSAAGDLCESLWLFDVYRGAGLPEDSRSLAFRLRFAAPDRTLTEADLAGVRAACVTAVEERGLGRLRG
jgi:phenylalanyl-tRNA synthetase beta chain